MSEAETKSLTIWNNDVKEAIFIEGIQVNRREDAA